MEGPSLQGSSQENIDFQGPGKPSQASWWLSGKVPLSLVPAQLTHMQSETCRHKPYKLGVVVQSFNPRT